MENLNSNSDSELAVWTSSFCGATGPTQAHAHHHQHSQSLTSQTHSYQPSQLMFLTSADDSPFTTPPQLSNSWAKGRSKQYTDTLTSSQLLLTQSQQQTLPRRANPYTVPSTSTFVELAENRHFQQQQQRQRNAEDTSVHTRSPHSPTPSHSHNGEVQSLVYSSPSASTLSHRSRIMPAAVAATAAATYPLSDSRPSGASHTGMGGEMEAKRDFLEDYLDLQDNDGDSEDGGVGGVEGHATYLGQQPSDAPHSSSRHSPLVCINSRNSLWITDLRELAGDAPSYTNSSTSLTKNASGKPPSCLPCPSIEVHALSTGNTSHKAASSATAGAATTMTMSSTDFAKKACPPPLSGFTPVAAVVSSSAPLPDPKASSGNTQNNSYNTNQQTNHNNDIVENNAYNSNHSNNNRLWSNRRTTSPPLSLGSSLKVSPSSHKGSAGLVDEERRLKEELQGLRQRVFETEQKLAQVQRQIAESSFNGGAGAVVSAIELNPQRFPQQSSSQTAGKMIPVETRSVDAASVSIGTAATHSSYPMSSSTVPRCTVGVPPMEMRMTPPQPQQQLAPHMTFSSGGSKVYVSSAPPSASVAMTQPASSESSGLASNGMTYFVQNGAPFGVYVMPSTGTMMDAGKKMQAGGPGTGTTATTNTAAAAMLPAAPQMGGPPVQVLGAQPYMVNNNSTLCYMVFSPQAQQQQKQLAASGVLASSMPPPEFDSMNNNSSIGSGAAPMQGAALTHPPIFTTAALTTFAAAAKTLECPHIIMVGPASNGELTRKCFNVHGSMMGVVQYFPYDESAPPAPTATILTAAASPSASISGQSMSSACWSMRSANGGGGDLTLGNSCRSHDGVTATDLGALPTRFGGSNAPSNNRKSSPITPGDLSTAPVLPIFIQMFPCELHDRITVLNRVIEATCGRDFGAVQRIESRSETSFIAHVRTHNVWQLIYKLRCRVLMDRFGFWYAADLDQYSRMKEYCEGVRRLPQQTRHFQTDGLPCMPLVVELSKAVDKLVVTENSVPRTFDEIIPIAAVDRHRTRLHSSTTTNTAAPTVSNESAVPNGNGRDNAVMGFAPTPMSSSGVFTEINATRNMGSSAAPVLASAAPPHWNSLAATTGEMSFLSSDNSLGGSARVGQSMYTDACQPSPLFM